MSSVFEIQDFTIATDWEHFIAEIELCFRNWKLENTNITNVSLPCIYKDVNNNKNNDFYISSKSIEFDDYYGSYTLNYYKWDANNIIDINNISLNDLKNSRKWEEQIYEQVIPNYLKTSTKLLSQSNLFKFIHWFNCNEFILLQPNPTSFGDVSLTQSQSHLLLSSLFTALNNCGKSGIPVFVPVRDHWRDEYIGYCQFNYLYNFGGEIEETIVDYHSEAVFSSPYSLPTRHSLVKLFFDKLGISRQQKVKFSITSRLSYFRRSGNNLYSNDLETEESLMYDNEEDTQYIRQFNNLFYGSSQDPIRVLRLISSWVQYGSSPNIEKTTKSKLNPLEAGNWTIRMRKESENYYHMSSYMRAFLLNFNEAETMSTINTSSNNINQTKKKLPIITAMSIGLKLLKTSKIASSKEIDSILAVLFHYKKEDIQIKPKYINLATDHGFAPTDCILSVLVSFMIRLEGFSSICRLWEEFVKEIRWHWEQNPPKKIPLLDSPKESIDMKRCLIYQKLQMINYCVEQANKAYVIEETKKSNTFEKDGWEIAFAVNDDDNSLLSIPETESKHRKGASKLLEPKISMLMFDENNKEDNIDDSYIYIPFTQSIGLLSEDMLEEQQQQVMDSANVISYHQLQLKSDMEAFKAANPGCVMADFVRWYSPADWLAEDSKDLEREKDTLANSGNISKEVSDGIQNIFPGKGILSARMRAVSNTWRTIWEESKPIPVTEQKPLFNFKKEAEKAIHYLETISPSDLMQQISGIAIRECLNTLCCSQSMNVKCVLKSIQECAIRIQQASISHIGQEEIDIILDCLIMAESIISQADALLIKFDNQFDLVNGLLSNGQHIVSSETSRIAIEEYFRSFEGGFGPAEEEEFIIQSQMRLPGTPLVSAPVLQRLFANITGNEYRIATSFSRIQ